ETASNDAGRSGNEHFHVIQPFSSDALTRCCLASTHELGIAFHASPTAIRCAQPVQFVRTLIFVDEMERRDVTGMRKDLRTARGDRRYPPVALLEIEVRHHQDAEKNQ